MLPHHVAKKCLLDIEPWAIYEWRKATYFSVSHFLCCTARRIPNCCSNNFQPKKGQRNLAMYLCRLSVHLCSERGCWPCGNTCEIMSIFEIVRYLKYSNIWLFKCSKCSKHSKHLKYSPVRSCQYSKRTFSWGYKIQLPFKSLRREKE